MHINNDLLIELKENNGAVITDEAVVRLLFFKAISKLLAGNKVTVKFNMATLPVELVTLQTRVCEELRPYTSIEIVENHIR